MTFFYSAVGILLFSSIVLVNRFIVLFSNTNFDNINSQYVGTQYQQTDRFLLQIINDGRDFGEGVELCMNLKRELNFSGLTNSKNFEYINYGLTKAKHQDIANSCILSDGSHRVLVKKKTSVPILYSLNSCILQRETICSFEIGAN